MLLDVEECRPAVWCWAAYTVSSE